MPSAGDPFLLGQIPVSHDPLQRVSFQGFKNFFDLAAMIQQTIDFLEDIFFDLVFDLTGIDLRSVTDLVDSIIGAIVDAIGDLFGIDLEALGLLNPLLILQRLMDFIPGLGGGSFDLITIAQDFIENILDPTGMFPSISGIVEAITGILGGDLTDLAGFNPLGGLIGLIGGLIGIGSITGSTPNLLTNPRFESVTSLLGQDLWSWDPSVGQTGLGSALTTVTGVARSLLSNAIQVVPGQTFDLSAFTQWSGLVSTGNPIALLVNVYDSAYSLIATPLIQAFPSPGSSNTWTQLAGQYEVPELIGVSVPAWIRVNLNVGDTATAGQVWFDNISATASSLMPQGLVSGLEGALASIAGQFQNILDALFGVFTGTTGVDTLLSEVVEAIEDFFTILSGGTVGGVGGIVSDIQDFFTDLLTNSSPLNGSNILSGSILSQFVPDLSATIDNIVNGLLGFDGEGWSMLDSLGALLGTSTTATVHGSLITAVQGLLGTHNSILDDHNGQIAALWAHLAAPPAGGGGTGGPVFVDNFNRTSGSGLGGNWSESYGSGNGHWATDGNNAYWVDLFPHGPRDSVNTCTGPDTVTDYQIVSISMAGAPGMAPIFGDSGYIHVYGRDMAVRLRVGGNGTWAVHNGATLLVSGTCNVPGPGTSISIYCGDKATSDLQRVKAIVGNVTVVDATFSGLPTGSGNRGHGFGGRVEGSLFSFTYKPGAVNFYQAGDQ